MNISTHIGPKAAARVRREIHAERNLAAFVNNLGWVREKQANRDRSRLSWAERGVLIEGKEE